MLTSDDLDNLRDLAKRQTANHAEKKILAAVDEIERLRREVESLQHQVAAASISADQYDALDRKTQELFEALQSLVQHLHPGASLTRMDSWDAPWPQVATALRR